MLTTAGTRRTAVCLAACLTGGVAGCGGGVTSPGAAIHVAGTYATAVTLVEDTCGGVNVEPRPTVVTHAAGDTHFTLTHAALVFTGTLALDGSFTTEPVSVRDAGTSTLQLAGRFRTTGFDANVAVEVLRTGGGSTCRYLVHWIGTKEGPPNDLP